MGVVYLAERQEAAFSQLVALKVLKRGMDSADIIARFAQERQLLSGLTHPNIARLLDGGTTPDGRPYFVLEYIEGRPIDAYCDANRLGIGDRLQLFRKVCAAVHHAHQNLIVHRDLKPGNILVTAEGEPKLLDFGIAKLLNPGLMPVHVHTGPELRLMTPEYASPEQVRGDPLTTASDIYALGVLLYELLTGRRPYRFRTRLQHEIARVICESDPERPSTVVTRVDTLPGPSGETTTLTPAEVARSREEQPSGLRRRLEGDIDDIVLMAMEKVPQKRYASAEAFSADIARHIDGLPVSAHRHSGILYRSGKFVRRHRAGAAAAAMILAALITGGAVAAWQWSRAESALERQTALLLQSNARYDAVRRLSSLFLGESSGSTYFPSVAERERLIAESVRGLETLAADSTPDPGLQAAIAAAYKRLGDLAGGQRGQNTGDRERARELYGKSLEIRQRLHDAAPTAESGLSLAQTHRAIGEIAADTADAAVSLRKSLELLNAVPRAKDRESQRELEMQRSGTMLSLAGVLQRLGDPAAADLYASAATTRETAYKADPSKATRREFAAALALLGDYHRGTGDRAAEIATRERALALRTQAAEMFPDDPTARRDLITSLYMLAMARTDKSDAPATAAALTECERAISMVRAAIEADPADARLREDLGRALEIKARAQRSLDQHEGALKTFDELAKHADEHLGRTGQKSGATARQAAAASVGAGRCLLALQRLDEASDRISAGLARWRAEAAADPANLDTARAVASTLALLSEVQEKQVGAAPEPQKAPLSSRAAATTRAALESFQALQSRTGKPEDAETLRDLTARGTRLQ